MVKLDCGCVIRKITEPEKSDYNGKVEWIADEVCEEHKRIEKAKKEGKKIKKIIRSKSRK